MAYDPNLAERIRRILQRKNADFTEKEMIGGLCFLVDDKMICGIHIDKKYGDSLLMARIGETATEQALEAPHCLPMDFTGRPMKGYVFVTPDGFGADAQLAQWVQKTLDFNPRAKKSKK